MTEERQLSDRNSIESSAPALQPNILRDIALTPRIKIFLSADIVGSTAFKQSFRLDPKSSAVTSASIAKRQRWQQTIEEFYDRIKERFPVVWVIESQKPGIPSDLRPMLAGRAPRFWKTAGDEVLFWKEITHEAQLWLLLHAWLQTIAEIRPMLRKHGLDVKCAMWLAEFPLRNCALATRNDEKKTARQSLIAGIRDPLGLRGIKPLDQIRIDDNHQLLGSFYRNPYHNAGDADFLGPGIDVGFRISSFASQRRMALSVDVAYLLAVSRLNLFGASSDGNDDQIPDIVRSKNRQLHPPMAATVASNRDRLADAVATLAIASHFAPCINDGRGCNLLKNLAIHYSGAEPLKGVLGGIKYPRFWISIVEAGSYEDAKQRMYLRDRSDDYKGPIKVSADTLLENNDTIGEGPVREGPTWSQLYRYCRAFYLERQNYIRPPVIIGQDKDSKAACIAWSSTCEPEAYSLYMKAYRIADKLRQRGDRYG